MADLEHTSGTDGQHPISPLDSARANYVELLGAASYLVYTTLRQPDYYDVLDQGAREYTNTFGDYLLLAASVEQPGGVSHRGMTIGETARRREDIEKRFVRSPISLYPETEAIIGAISILEAGLNTYADHPATVIGSTILATTSYMSYKYRKGTKLELEIRDNKLTERMLTSEDSNMSDAPEFWLAVLDATLDSEKAAVAKLLSKTLRASTFTPFGYTRQYYYRYRRHRQSRTKP